METATYRRRGPRELVEALYQEPRYERKRCVMRVTNYLVVLMVLASGCQHDGPLNVPSDLGHAADGCVVSNSGVEACDGVDNDCNGAIDDTGPEGLGCATEIWRLQNMSSDQDIVLAQGQDHGMPPMLVPGFKAPGSYPGFLVYQVAAVGSVPLFECVRSAAPPAHYYTTDPNDPTCAGSYSAIDQQHPVGYLLAADPGSSARYFRWIHAKPDARYTGNPLGATGLWVMKYGKSDQRYYCGANQISGLISFGYCCERGPAQSCVNHWCGQENTSALGWIFMPTL